MYAKIFGQIFDSSIAADHVVRHTFMDLLVLADMDGVVDMTLDAIARRTNVPIEIVSHAIAVLMEPDVRSRSDLQEGRRLILLDSHRDWGWQIVNYDHYRKIRDEEARKSYFRDYKRDYRNKQKQVGPTQSTPVHSMSTPVLDSPTMSTKEEAEANTNTEKPKNKAASAFELPDWINRQTWEDFEEMRRKIRKPMTLRAKIGIVGELRHLREAGNDPERVLAQSIMNSWQGVFEVRNGGSNGKRSTTSQAAAELIRELEVDSQSTGVCGLDAGWENGQGGFAGLLAQAKQGTN